MNDWIADVKLALDVLPNQAKSAFDFVQAFIQDQELKDVFLDSEEFSHTGHSLGGAIAKLVGIGTGAAEIETFSSPGVDQLFGGSGNDTFVFTALDSTFQNVDTIHDFQSGDLFDLVGLGIQSLDELSFFFWRFDSYYFSFRVEFSAGPYWGF